jgi:hypothetical protein
VEELTGIKTLWDKATDSWVLGGAVVTYLIIRFASRLVHAVNNPRATIVWRKAMPIMPELIAVTGVMFDGIPWLHGKSFEVRVAVAIWIAYLSTKAMKLLGQTLLGDDDRIEAAVKQMMKRR